MLPSPVVVVPEFVAIPVMIAVMVAMVLAERIAVMIPVMVPVAIVVPIVVTMLNPVVPLSVLVTPVVLRQRRPSAQRQAQDGYQSHPKCLVHDSSP
jgi:hypothetical protein